MKKNKQYIVLYIYFFIFAVLTYIIIFIMNKTCVLCGVFNYDTIVQREYPDGFVTGKRNKFTERVIHECVGGTCGNVSTMLPWLGVKSFPIAHFDMSEQAREMTEDIKHYGADARFVLNDMQGNTALLRCTHKLDDKTGKPAMGFHATSPDSNYVSRKYPRMRDEAPALLEQIDFVPDFYFFDIAEAGVRTIAEGLKKRGSIIYFEPESDKDMQKLLKAVNTSDIVKFSREKISDISFCDDYSDKLFIMTMGAEGIQYKLCSGEWKHLDSPKNGSEVDWEGAGDWFSSQLIAAMCENDVKDITSLSDECLVPMLKKAMETASRSVSFMSSKGMIDECKGGPRQKDMFDIEESNIPTTGIIGTVCGDIIGSDYEQHKKRTKKFNFNMFPKDAHFSDDTVMTIAIAQWLQGEHSTDRLVDIMVEMGRRYIGAGYGHKFKEWLNNDTHEPYGAASNGAAMRVGAIGWAFDTLEETLSAAKQTADVSHSSEEGEKGAMSVAAAIFMARNGKSKDEIKRYIEDTFGYDLSRKIEDIRPDYKFEILCSRSVPEAIICWLQSDTYEEAIRNAVSLGGDADTQAAIAGAIAAATPGMEVPKDIAVKCVSYLTPKLKRMMMDFYNR